MSLFNQLNEVFQEVFEDNELQIERNSTANDLEDWDSLMHVNLILAVEREFGIRFTSSEVTSLSNVSSLIDLIEKKL